MMKKDNENYLGPEWKEIDWFTNKQAAIDLRLFFFFKPTD